MRRGVGTDGCASSETRSSARTLVFPGTLACGCTVQNGGQNLVGHLVGMGRKKALAYEIGEGGTKAAGSRAKKRRSLGLRSGATGRGSAPPAMRHGGQPSSGTSCSSLCWTRSLSSRPAGWAQCFEDLLSRVNQTVCFGDNLAFLAGRSTSARPWGLPVPVLQRHGRFRGAWTS